MTAIRVLTLDRTPDRLATFRAVNPHVPAEVMRAVDGKTLDRVALEAKGAIGPGLIHSDGALGCLFSHLRFWDDVIAADLPMTIFEDDAIVHRSFMGASEAVLASLPRDWHICLWGWNFNAVMRFEMIPGVATCLGHNQQDELRRNIGRYQTTEFVPRAARLLLSWGTISYAISPEGARYLRSQPAITQQCSVQFPEMKVISQNEGVDVIMNAFYPHMSAFVCIPPLVVTTQDRSVIVPENGA